LHRAQAEKCLVKHQRILAYVDAVVRTGSFRKAAERMNVTGSALTRRILDLEKELGAPLFERRPRGVRLTSAGEIFVAFARAQIAEAQRLASRIEDLRGLRRGTVRMACSQALAHGFLPQMIGLFSARHPLITFQVEVLDHEAALAALAGYAVDLVLVYRPTILGDLQPLTKVPQRLVALFPVGHKLKGRGPLRLRECIRHPLAMPERPIGGRLQIDEFAARTGTTISPAVESNSFEFLRGCVRHAGMVSFQIELGVGHVGMRESGGILARPIDERDIPRADLVLGQLRGRNLPVAAALFAELLGRELAALG
jgi:DNA-binding transcriptional LysR family regulator